MADVSMRKKYRAFVSRLARGSRAQSLTEYILVIAFIAVAIGLAWSTWNGPLARFLNGVSQVIVKTR